MPVYDLPIWATDAEPFPSAGFSGAGWAIMAREVPIENGTIHDTKHFLGMRKKYPKYSVGYILYGESASRIAPQLIMHAPSRISAQRAFGILLAAFAIIDGTNMMEMEDAIVVPSNRRRLEDLDKYDVLATDTYTISRSGVPIACRLAAKISRSAPLQYAAFKLQLSYRITSRHHIEFSPTYDAKRFGVSRSRLDHVNMASAVTLAYSAIEEMQLEPRPHGNRPVKKNGVWDDVAYRDLRSRLDRAGVRSTAPVIWNERGPLTRIHKSDRSPKGTRLSWTRGQVRDKGVTVEDALLMASWLRSKCTTHKFGLATSSISMFDVFNVQSLTRRLVLERSGIWDKILRSAQKAT